MNDAPVSPAASDSAGWYAIGNADDVPSPALLVYPGRIETNVRRMIAMAGGPDRLRPHVRDSELTI